MRYKQADDIITELENVMRNNSGSDDSCQQNGYIAGFMLQRCKDIMTRNDAFAEDMQKTLYFLKESIAERESVV